MQFRASILILISLGSLYSFASAVLGEKSECYFQSGHQLRSAVAGSWGLMFLVSGLAIAGPKT
jgi:hypothetical protein